MFFCSFWPLHPYYIEYTAMKTFVSIAQKTNPNIKFVVMSSLGTLNPFWIPSLLINTLFCGKTKYKYLANEYLRQSGLNYNIMRPPQLVDDFDKLDKDLTSQKLICISQSWNPIQTPNGKDVSDKRKAGMSANAMLRSECANVLAELAANKTLDGKLSKCTFNVWQGYKESIKINNGSRLDYDCLHNDSKDDLQRFKGINHDKPYWMFISGIIVSSAVFVKMVFPNQTTKGIQYVKRKAGW